MVVSNGQRMTKKPSICHCSKISLLVPIFFRKKWKRYSIRLFLPVDKRYASTTGMQTMLSLFWKHKVQSAAFSTLPDERIRNCRQNCLKKGKTTESCCPLSTRATLRHGFPRAGMTCNWWCNFEGNVEGSDELAAKSGISGILTNTNPIREY